MRANASITCSTRARLSNRGYSTLRPTLRPATRAPATANSPATAKFTPAMNDPVDAEELGGWRVHADTTGFADQVVDTDEQALDAIKTFLSYLPSHHHEAPPVKPGPAGSGKASKDILKLLPESPPQAHDMRKV